MLACSTASGAKYLRHTQEAKYSRHEMVSTTIYGPYKAPVKITVQTTRLRIKILAP